ncbi:MAG: hypothetical protein FWF02_02890 [Micrococcales bacterium]|nr:hypothetical protein [Micrococcales bacterium]MCL2666636.1 hypothetical protein [Micrococcales bacterium]
MTQHHAYSQVAADQLDIAETADPGLYRDLVDTCEAILDDPSRHRAAASAVVTHDGVVLRTPVPRRPPYKVFWSSDGPRIEAVFPYPT